MKTVKRLSALMLAVLLLAALSTTAFAAFSYTGIAGGQIKVEKYLVMSSDATTPAVTFSFAISNGTAIPANTTDNKLAIRAGSGDPAVVSATAGGSNIPVVGTAAFTANQTTYTSAQTLPSDTGTQTAGLTNDPVTLNANQKYARSEFTVNFSNVKFTEPGVYRWILTEEANAAAAAMGISNDTDPTRVLDVYVCDKNDGSNSLEIIGYVLHNDESFQPTMLSTATEPSSSSKAKGFVNNFESVDLTISVQVAGNQASRDQYFKLTVTIEEAGAGTVIPVDLTHADQNPTANAASPSNMTANPSSITAGDGTNGTTSGSVTQVFYLQHGQSVTLTGLPKNARYSITEENLDYAVSTSTVEGTAAAVTGTSATVSDEDITANTTVAYTNTREGTIPTGVMLTVVPGVVIVMLALGGLMVIRRKKNEA